MLQSINGGEARVVTANTRGAAKIIPSLLHIGIRDQDSSPRGPAVHGVPANDDTGLMFRTLSSTALALLIIGLSGATANANPTPRWQWPIDTPHPIVRPFIAPETRYSPGHRGIDISVGNSPAVRAPAAGVVHFSGTVVNRPVLSIRHLGGLISSYEPVTSALTRGDAVTRGEVIGEVQPGHCIHRCLHFGVRFDGEYVSPLNYLTSIPRAILLPTRAP